MPWIKKNLTLVLGGLVGLVLLGGSAFFLYDQSNRETTVNAALEEKREEWNRLNALNPYPEEKNIKAVRAEAERVGALTKALRESIHAPNVQPVSDTFSLKLLIETTISQLQHEAEESGVHLPDRYAFTFQKLREMPYFEPNGIPKLAEQVAQISALSRVLFAAKVHSLDQLRRPGVLKEEVGSTEYLTKKAVTNNWVVRSPFDLSFRSFSTELAAALQGFAAMDEVVAIKTINIQPTSLPRSMGAAATPVYMSSPMPSPSPMPMPGGAGGGMDPALRARYGLGGGSRSDAETGGGGGGMDAAMRSRYGLGPPGAAGGEAAMRSRYGMGGAGGIAAPPPSLSSPMFPTAPGPVVSATPSVVLDEKPLRVIIQLDFIKPKPEPEPTARRASRPAPSDVAPDDAPADSSQ
ncbi:MAG: hypothetical protein AB7O66_24140 [Limisphaerales bacterium]